VRVLVVDDEPDLESLLRQKFRRQIREREYEFHFAHDGVEALEKLRQIEDIDIILSDINMPRMDGLTLLLKVSEMNIIVKSVMVSAYGDMANIRTAMNRGAFDFVTKPIDFTDLEMTLGKTRAQIKILKQAAREHQTLNALLQELNVASNIQASIVPNQWPAFPDRKDFDLFAMMRPAKEVGGDFYDFFLIDETRLGFAIGDVSGKGVPAAIFMAMSRTLLRATALTGISSQECMTYTNKILTRDDSASMFVTAIYGILNTKTGEVDICMAGHEPPILLRADTAPSLVSLPGNLALAIEEDFPIRSATITMKPGDTLILVTDGITEAENPTHALFGKEQLISLLGDTNNLDPRDVVRFVLAGVQQFTAGHPQNDDITCLALQFRGT